MKDALRIFREKFLNRRNIPPSLGTLLKAPNLGWRGRRRVPVVRQTTAADCGAACLAMILGAYGKNVPLAEVREAIGIGRDGVSAHVLAKVAQLYGLRAQGVSLDLNEMAVLPLPAILHWDFSHFVVLTRWTRRGGEIIDPGEGRRTLSREDFDASFTGVALVFEPTAHFEEQAAPKREWRRYLGHLIGARIALAKVLAYSLVLQGLGLSFPLLTTVIVDKVIPQRAFGALSMVSMGLIAYLASFSLSTYLRSLTLLHVQIRLDERMMLDFFEYLLGLPFAFFQVRSTGDLLMRLSSIGVVREILSQQFLSLASDGLLLAGYLGLMIWYKPTLAIIVVTIALLQVLMVWLSIQVMKELVQKDVLAQSRSQSYLVEAMRGIETVKVSAAESHVFSLWRRLFTSQLQASLARQQKSALLGTCLSGLAVTGPLVLLVAGAVFVLRGELTLGAMLGFNALAASFLAPLTSLIGSAQGLQVIGTHLDRLEEVFTTPQECKENPCFQHQQLVGQIAVEDVSFRYGPRAPFVVRNLSFTVEPGQMVAIVGPSGSGKSTLAKLLMGLYEPTSGRITYDGLDLKTFDLRLIRRQLGIVLQGSFLFNDTVRRNISLCDPEMSLDQVIRASQIACIAQDIEAMPMAYETQLSEMANNLSGGQRQRLCLARALAHEPKIVLLDEATSEVDTATEAAIHENLDSLKATRIVIAHRLSTVRDADTILVMEEGRIVERGRHSELVARGGLFSTLVKGQAF